MIVPNPRNTKVTAVHILFCFGKCDHKRLMAGMRLTVMHDTGIIKVKTVKRTSENLRYMIICDTKKMIAHSLMALVYPK